MGTHRPFSGDQSGVIDLPAIAQNMGVRVGRDAQFPLPDEPTDFRPTASLTVEETDSAVPEIVR